MFRKPILFLAALALLLSACATPAILTATLAPTAAAASTEAPTAVTATEAAAAPADGAITLTDSQGNKVTLAGPAQKIVSLAPSNTEILFAIGAGAQVIGRDMFSDYPEAAKAVADIGGSFGDLNVEAIVALEPDLVLAANINTPEQVKALQDVGLTVFSLPNPVTLEEMYANLRTVAQLTGRTGEAEALIDDLKARVAAVTEKVAPLSYAPTVFYELDATDPNAPYTSGPGTFVDTLITMAGGINVAGALDTQWATISTEKLVEMNPEIIILGDSNYGTTAEMVAARAGWEAIAAVENGNIFPFDDNLTSRPGPRLVDALEMLAKLLHPEAFE
ncbi:MAG: ABC transporter substrate-binding protein [Chloroflexota bacterium]